MIGLLLHTQEGH